MQRLRVYLERESAGKLKIKPHEPDEYQQNKLICYAVQRFFCRTKRLYFDDQNKPFFYTIYPTKLKCSKYPKLQLKYFNFCYALLNYFLWWYQLWSPTIGDPPFLNFTPSLFHVYNGVNVPVIAFLSSWFFCHSLIKFYNSFQLPDSLQQS